MANVNEILQWVVIAVLALFVLGLLREVSLLLPGRERSAPSAGQSGLNGSIPKATWQAIEAAVGPIPEAGDLQVVFVTESCTGCQQLLADLEHSMSDARANGGLPSGTLLVAQSGSEGFVEAVGAVGLPVLWDDGSIWRECQISVTPFVIRTEADGRIVNREVSHHVELFADHNP